MGRLRVVAAVAVLAVMTVVLMPLQWLAIRRKWRLAALLPWYWQRAARRMIGLKVHVVGVPAPPPALLAANHVSWLDITLLGSILPVSFVAKAEIAGWPVAGTLARLQRTIFIDRTKRTQTASAKDAIARRVGDGDVMVLFAEGTTGDGNRLLPFMSALIGAAGAAAASGTITVQPVAISYVGVHGMPVGRSDRPYLAWYGDMEFLSHFAALVRRGAVDAVVSFGEPIAFSPEMDRKRVAEDCFAAVRAMIDRSRRLPPENRHPGDLFSQRRKGAKAAGKASPPPQAETARSDIVNRVS